MGRLRQMGSPRLKPLFLRLAGLLLAATGVRADLAPTSPFLPAAAAAGAQSGPEGPIELRGVMSSDQGSSYCIYDTAKKTSAWVGLNEPGYDFLVKGADADGDAVTVTYQGRILRLVLHTAKVASSGSGNSSAAPLPPGQQGGPVIGPAEEQRRLEAVAAEVRRRRAERERAVQAAQNGQPLAPPPTPAR